MKKFLPVVLILSTMAFVTSAKVNNRKSFLKNDNISVPITNDPNLILEFKVLNSAKVVRVSFNGKEGILGDIKLFNAQNELVGGFNLELIKFPNYATIDVSNIPSGNYSVELTTKVAIHSSSVIIN